VAGDRKLELDRTHAEAQNRFLSQASHPLRTTAQAHVGPTSLSPTRNHAWTFTSTHYRGEPTPPHTTTASPSICVARVNAILLSLFLDSLLCFPNQVLSHLRRLTMTTTAFTRFWPTVTHMRARLPACPPCGHGCLSFFPTARQPAASLPTSRHSVRVSIPTRHTHAVLGQNEICSARATHSHPTSLPPPCPRSSRAMASTLRPSPASFQRRSAVVVSCTHTHTHFFAHGCRRPHPCAPYKTPDSVHLHSPPTYVPVSPPATLVCGLLRRTALGITTAASHGEPRVNSSACPRLLVCMCVRVGQSSLP
jgi:hypothetical protein